MSLQRQWSKGENEIGVELVLSLLCVVFGRNFCNGKTRAKKPKPKTSLPARSKNNDSQGRLTWMWIVSSFLILFLPPFLSCMSLWPKSWKAKKPHQKKSNSAPSLALTRSLGSHLYEVDLIWAHCVMKNLCFARHTCFLWRQRGGWKSWGQGNRYVWLVCAPKKWKRRLPTWTGLKSDWAAKTVPKISIYRGAEKKKNIL